jgi:hypothetical protein
MERLQRQLRSLLIPSLPVILSAWRSLLGPAQSSLASGSWSLTVTITWSDLARKVFTAIATEFKAMAAAVVAVVDQIVVKIVQISNAVKQLAQTGKTSFDLAHDN